MYSTITTLVCKPVDGFGGKLKPLPEAFYRSRSVTTLLTRASPDLDKFSPQTHFTFKTPCNNILQSTTDTLSSFSSGFVTKMWYMLVTISTYFILLELNP
jgi:hypothetical protein